jgi:hypothetical protein
LDELSKKLDIDEEDISDTPTSKESYAKTIDDASNAKENLEEVVHNDTQVQEALIRFLRSTQDIDRELLARASVLISAVVVSPAARVNYTGVYRHMVGRGYQYNEAEVHQQDCLVRACWEALDERNIDPSKFESKFHSSDANFHTTIQREMQSTRPGVSPIEVTAPCDCFVYTCGDTPDPLPSVEKFLYADDYLVWTHTSRLWSYPCWGKSWSKAAKTKTTNPNHCTRFVICIKNNFKFECFPMDMKHTYPGEVHIAEAPLHLGALLDSLVLHAAEGVRLKVTQEPKSVEHETYAFEVHCDLVAS